MPYYRITSIVNMSVMIEDLGVYLSCKGNSAIADVTAVLASKDLKECQYQRWVKVEGIPVKPKPMPVWPFIKLNTDLPAIRPEPEKLPEKVFEKPVVSTVMAPEVQQSIASLCQRMDQMMQLLSTKVIFNSGQVSSPGQVTSITDNPMFIPDSIVPEKAETSINTKESESTRSDFESSMAALKNSRKKKP